ncbi:Clp amino terminal domain-containing protein, pathogenicity island component [Actinacidiphila alni]|uniref:Clp amino terminal domain-containing protein, pathogenicity island component n=1 Tax=Actinacidiphila alni TaxID=380248 RepID=A0A1I1YJT6_9ACTN|nr:Clp protease N-terminal domain-containing protein [Actinacidiphila alni]SFE19562.1 Clp amino terminal domain-containing protein, pathogenicity island component [Actinacidiphila alni]
MFERFTPETRTVVVHAQEHARRLGHTSIGCEHLLLALVAADQPAAAVLREHGVTPEGVEREIVRQVGLGAGSDVFGTRNRDALASIGIDLDAVRARLEESFGPDALVRADRAAHLGAHPVGPRRRRGSVRLPHWRRRRTDRTAARVPALPAGVTGRYEAAFAARPVGHIPFTPRAKESLADTLREAQSQHAPRIGLDHLALALITVTSDPARSVLTALGASPRTLRTAIVRRYGEAN